MTIDSHKDRTGGKLPRGPHKLTDAQVADDQRKRLIEAMIQLAAGLGYAATTVADVIMRAQVSRKAFYEHFEDRKDLLLAAFDNVSQAAFEEIEAAAQRGGGPSRQIEALMRRLCRVARESPGTIALTTIEIAAVDPDGLERRERLMGAYGELLDLCLRTDPDQPALPPLLARTLAGGAYRTIDAQLRAGHSEELTAISTQLARWTRAQHPVPPSLMKAATNAGAPARIGVNGLYGGRAPGTLTLSPDGYKGPNMSRSKGFKTHANRERILDAVTQLSAAHGYTELTARAIAERADLSERGFLAHFKNKDEAFAAAVEARPSEGAGDRRARALQHHRLAHRRSQRHLRADRVPRFRALLHSFGVRRGSAGQAADGAPSSRTRRSLRAHLARRSTAAQATAGDRPRSHDARHLRARLLLRRRAQSRRARPCGAGGCISGVGTVRGGH